VYIIDEPTIGLHPDDRANLFTILQAIKERDNSIVLVEHDREFIKQADHLILLGPGAGKRGGEIVANSESLNPYRAERARSARELKPPYGSAIDNGEILLQGARLHNLKNLSVGIPLNTLTCVTGISGCGKSSLVLNTLYPAVRLMLENKQLTPSQLRELRLESLQLDDSVRRVVTGSLKEKPSTPHSLVVTHSGLFAQIRDMFSSLRLSRVRGYNKTTFSLSSPRGGRCQYCKGTGIDPKSAFSQSSNTEQNSCAIPCSACSGRRYQKEILEVHYKGLSIAGVLDLTVAEAGPHLELLPGCGEILKGLKLFHLEYLQLGQPTSTLSNGELQRLRLCTTLQKRKSGTLYLLDEPTSGLDQAETGNLIQILYKIVAAKNTVIAIEHNLFFIHQARHIIDLGPGAGSAGGQIAAQGSPEELLQISTSKTGNALRKWMDTIH